MATETQSGRERPGPREPEVPDRPQIVVVDLGKRQSRKRVRQLRKGRGKLMPRVERIVNELVESGTLKADAQRVVIVVRERLPIPWPFTIAAE